MDVLACKNEIGGGYMVKKKFSKERGPLKSIYLRAKKSWHGSGGIRTHAIEMTGALNQRLRPLGHATYE